VRLEALKIVRAVKLDRGSVERAAFPIAERLAATVSSYAGAAVKLHANAARARSAVGVVMRGDARTQQPGFQRLVVKAMLLADLKGRVRFMRNAGDRLDKSVRLSRDNVYDQAIEATRERLGMSLEYERYLEEEYGKQASKVIGRLVDEAERRVYERVTEGLKQGKRIPQLLEAMRQALAECGASPRADWALTNIVRTQTQIAYAAGRTAASMSEAAQDAGLWGWEYSAIEDDRTTALCQSLDGTRLPAADPFWKRWTPPNHWQCRSTVIEVFEDEGLGAVPPGEEPEAPAPGFDLNFGTALLRAR
jgi:SPP1 gp7 family putative phage head morphogenesis protein